MAYLKKIISLYDYARSGKFYFFTNMIGWLEYWRDRRLTEKWLNRYGLLCFELDDGRIAYGLHGDDIATNSRFTNILAAANAYANEMTRFTGQPTQTPSIKEFTEIKRVNDFWMWAFYEPGTGLYW